MTCVAKRSKDNWKAIAAFSSLESLSENSSGEFSIRLDALNSSIISLGIESSVG